MTSTFFDAGDLQRLDRERSLTEEAPRQLPEENRSPEQDVSILNVRDEPDFGTMLSGLLDALRRRLQ